MGDKQGPEVWIVQGVQRVNGREADCFVDVDNDKITVTDCGCSRRLLLAVVRGLNAFWSRLFDRARRRRRIPILKIRPDEWL